MSKVSDAIKKYTKSHTLLHEIGGVLINKTGFANRYMSTVNAMYKTYTKVNKKYKGILDTIEVEKYNCEDMSDTIWICWLQGIEKAPELVQSCFASAQHHIKGRKIVEITIDNFSDYTSLPDYIIEKWKKGIISNTLFSDLLRINILNRHGGLWVDSTVYFTGDVPSYITDSDFFVYRNGWFDEELINFGSWLIYSKPNNILLLECEAIFNEYFKKQNFIWNYFMFHFFFRMVTDKHPEEWEKVPYYNHIDQHILANEMAKKYDETRFKQICEISPIHKLTYKLDNIEIQNDSYYSRLSELYSQNG